VLVVNSTNRRNDTVISIDEVRKPWHPSYIMFYMRMLLVNILFVVGRNE
jgi:hypothetical protein